MALRLSPLCEKEPWLGAFSFHKTVMLNTRIMLQLCPLERSHKKESLHVKSVKIFLCFSLQESVIIDSIFVLVNTRCLTTQGQRKSDQEDVGGGRVQLKKSGAGGGV